MRLGKLYESCDNISSNFFNLYQSETLNEATTINEVKNKISNIINEADKYAALNNMKYKYMDLAKNPLWTDVIVEAEMFIYQGFEAFITIDLNESLEKITPFVLVKNNNVTGLMEGQRIEITEAFVNGLNKLQREIFDKSLSIVESRTVKTFQTVWGYEKARIDKWIKTSEIDLGAK